MSDDLRKSFPVRLRHVREMREMSQQQLAKIAKLNPTVISHFERGSRLPSLENLKAISKGLMVSSDYLMGLSERYIL